MIKERHIWFLLRLTLGWLFLWAFLDKLLGLGLSTPANKSWLAGISPTAGFLKNATTGPFAPFFHSLANNTFVDGLFMAGLLLIGLALILGIGSKIAGFTGALLMILMWLALLPPKNNPFLDEHLIYLVIFLGFATRKSDHWFGLGEWWSKTSLVRQHRFLE
ncbi:hypothetical protein HY439_02095 [Candidatus Microgenomates bacterium]|nr:hypothetical protein [Candidatus Microgenomates bacterium]